ncbi:MAG: leucyl aminopeptidase [Gammaproteobacteria bacterium]|nr:leucyl aminopeptidase [Gammaproteobacteria bacterium]MCW8972828.1 leucyl aminopeptidase [Gammaproteobacteria bacterium]MCW8992099.1 leucyl aminopeptidase [Gammaproteobacteria bacterium]
MEFNTSTGPVHSTRTGCLIVGIYEGKKLTPSARQLDEESDGIIKTALKGGDLSGSLGQTLMLTAPQGLSCERLLLVGCGKEKELKDRSYRQIVQAAARALLGTKAKEALCSLAELPVPERELDWKVRQFIEAAGHAAYRFDQMKSKKKDEERPVLRKVSFPYTTRGEGALIKLGIVQGRAINDGIDLTKDLSNLPGNICTPSYLADQARALARQHKSIKTTILDEKQMEKLGMGALLSVSRGSRQPAKLIVMEFTGTTAKNKQKPIVLVGKGLTFDAGGISLKPAAAMDEMKYDMCGGASVFGTMKAIAEMELPINVVGVVPSSENLPDGDANKPGDIVTTMSGQTVEILNTDAEGRLILCDALTYSKKFDPSLVIDIATLTGACIVALGSHAAGLLANDDELAVKLLEAGQKSGDRAWQLPLWEEYDEQLKSPFADMANIGGKGAGTITAASFLARYTKEYKWAHLDIAGTAWLSNAEKGATGRPVPLLTQFLIDKAKGN